MDDDTSNFVADASYNSKFRFLCITQNEYNRLGKIHRLVADLMIAKGEIIVTRGISP